MITKSENKIFEEGSKVYLKQILSNGCVRIWEAEINGCNKYVKKKND